MSRCPCLVTQALKEQLMLSQQREADSNAALEDQRALAAEANNLNRKLERLVDIAEQEKKDAVELLSAEYVIGEVRAQRAARVAAAAVAKGKEAAVATAAAIKLVAKAGSIEANRKRMDRKLDTIVAAHEEELGVVTANLQAAQAKVAKGRLDNADARAAARKTKEQLAERGRAVKEKAAQVQAEKKARVAAGARARKSNQRLREQRATTKEVVAAYRLEVAVAHGKLDALVRDAAAEHEAVLAEAVGHLTLDLQEAEARADAAEAAKTFAFTTGGSGSAPGVANKRHRFKDEFFDVCVKFLFLGVPPKNVVKMIQTACECFGIKYDSLPQSAAPVDRANRAKAVLNQQQAADFMKYQAEPDEKLFFELMHDATS